MMYIKQQCVISQSRPDLEAEARINFIFVTEVVLQMVRGAGYCALYEGINSDHIMLLTDFDFKEFFGGSQVRTSSPQVRKFSYDNLQVRKKFTNELRKNHRH